MTCFPRFNVLLATMIASALAAGCGQPAAPPAEEAAAPAQDPVERGRYLVTVMDCNGCHTPFVKGEPDLTRMLSGHPQDVEITAPPPPPPAPWGVILSDTNTAWAGPWGVSFTTNLTPDRATGIGGWTEATFISSIRNGQKSGAGRPLLPPMPWPMYAQLTDEDLSAIFAYLLTIPPIENQVPAAIVAGAPAGGGN